MMNIEHIIYNRSKLVRNLIVGVGFVIVIISVKNTISLFASYAAITHDLSAIEASPDESRSKYAKDAFTNVDLNKVIFLAIGEAAKTNTVVVRILVTNRRNNIGR
jgi:hypothetical protein